jgi:hypothetical protein
MPISALIFGGVLAWIIINTIHTRKGTSDEDTSQ